MLVKCSAPGKIILNGEHSVVYGKLAIAASLDLRTNITIRETNTDCITFNFKDLNYEQSFKLSQINLFINGGEYSNPEGLNQQDFLGKIRNVLQFPDGLSKNQTDSLISALFLYYGIVFSSGVAITALSVEIMTALTLGSGTGSSASLMVGLSGAFLHYITLKNPQKMGIDPENYKSFTENQLKLISRWGFQAERIIHGNPSGVDNTVCTYGSLVSFRKGCTPSALKLKREITGLIVDTRVPKNTALQVQKVLKLKEKHPKIVDHVLEALENVAAESLDVLMKSGDDVNVEDVFGELGRLAGINHHLLQTLGVSHPSLDKVVELMGQFGIKGKMTGAGGGGYAMAVIPPFIKERDLAELCSQFDKEGFKGVVINLGCSGVRFEV